MRAACGVCRVCRVCRQGVQAGWARWAGWGYAAVDEDERFRGTARRRPGCGEGREVHAVACARRPASGLRVDISRPPALPAPHRFSSAHFHDSLVLRACCSWCAGLPGLLRACHDAHAMLPGLPPRHRAGTLRAPYGDVTLVVAAGSGTATARSLPRRKVSCRDGGRPHCPEAAGGNTDCPVAVPHLRAGRPRLPLIMVAFRVPFAWYCVDTSARDSGRAPVARVVGAVGVVHKPRKLPPHTAPSAPLLHHFYPWNVLYIEYTRMQRNGPAKTCKSRTCQAGHD